MRKNNLEVSFIGLGYIGLPTSVIAANKGMRVYGIDINPQLVDSINSTDFQTVEPGLQEKLAEVIKLGTLKAFTEIQPADVYLIVVPTPFKDDYSADLSYVDNAVQSLIPYLKPEDILIIESTCPVGTTEAIAKNIFDQRPELKNQLSIAYCPERVLPGNILHELIHNDRVIGGVDSKSTEKVYNFYKKFVKGELHKTDSKTAEMCKLTENASRDVQIAFANELSIICNQAGIDPYALIELANKHPRVNILQPGAGVGGHCIAVDPYFIIKAFPQQSKLMGMAREINDYKSQWCIEQVLIHTALFKKQHGRKPALAIMGLAFKPNIDDLRESPALKIAESLYNHSSCSKTLVVEPNINFTSLFELTSCEEALKFADIVVFSVAHRDFHDLKISPEKIVLDYCGVTRTQ